LEVEKEPGANRKINKRGGHNPEKETGPSPRGGDAGKKSRGRTS